jgi:F-type H+-transporting ATPase subunit b
MELFTPEISLIFWMLIPFLVVFFVLAKFAWPAILKGVEERNNFIDESLQSAIKANEQLAKVKVESEALLDDARKEQAKILAEAAKTRDTIIQSAKDKANVEASELVEMARKQIQAEKEDALHSIRREVAKISVDIAEKVLRTNLENNKDQMQMIDRLMDEVNIPKS